MAGLPSFNILCIIRLAAGGVVGGGYCRRMGQDSPKRGWFLRTHVQDLPTYLRTHVRNLLHTYLTVPSFTYVQMYAIYQLATYVFVRPSFVRLRTLPSPPPIHTLRCNLINLKLQLLLLPTATAAAYLTLFGWLDAWHRWWRRRRHPKLAYWGAERTGAFRRPSRRDEICP